MNDSVISVKMQGGLGNMMFQSAFALAFSFEKNCQYELFGFNQNCFANKQWLNRNADYYSNYVFQRLDLSEKSGENYIHPESEFHFSPQPFIEGKKNVYTGYYQSEKYFYDFSDQIKSIFQPSPIVLETIKSKYSMNFSEFTSVQVRRGDYVSQPNNHPVVTTEYLNRAMNYFGSNHKFLVFSDDINWCKENLKGYSNIQYTENELDYISLFMMSLCGNHILANSSFSWWGAWLNRNSNKTVIRPERWFGSNYDHLNTSDMCPENWKILK